MNVVPKPQRAETASQRDRNAVNVMKIATGEIEESLTKVGKSKAAVGLRGKGALGRSRLRP